MAILILIISVSFFIGSLIVHAKSGYCEEGIYLSCFLIVGSLIWSGYLSCRLYTASSIDEEIAVYEDMHESIEKSVSDAIGEYIDLEKIAFDDSAQDINAYLNTVIPTLQSSELVKEQVKIYKKNYKKLTKLKVRKAKLPRTKWWLNFGLF